jgi:Protein of unknown function (DUF4058)/Protein of unknown function (DUF2934)
MPSPFPGMDPYLEDDQLWPLFHHHLVLCLYQVLLPGLVDRYRARVVQRRYIVNSAVAHAPGVEHAEEVLAIRQRADDKLVTLVDVVSPANKTTAAGRRAYLEQRQAARAEQASVVEIDLVLQGRLTLDYSREGLPAWDYAVTVTRSIQPERYEIYTSTLQKRLPRFRLPLAPDDRDTVIDLQAAFARCFDQGEYAARIDYRRDPAAPLSIDQRLWLDQILRAQKRRDPLPPEEEIAKAAYFLWQAEGRPNGQDKEHWLRAAQELRMRRIGSG